MSVEQFAQARQISSDERTVDHNSASSHNSAPENNSSSEDQSDEEEITPCLQLLPTTVYHREQNDARCVLRDGEQKRSQSSSIDDKY